jgi:hypothetical protein
MIGPRGLPVNLWTVAIFGCLISLVLAAPDCTLPESSGSQFAADQNTFDIHCGYDYFGGDYAALPESTWNSCVAACDADSRCAQVAYAWVPGTCYMKDGQPAVLLPNDGVYAAKKQQTTTPAGPSCVDGASDNEVFVAAANEFTILCGVDFAGGDFDALSVNSFDECIAACDSDDECIDVSYAFAPRMCYKKNNLSIANVADWVWTARKNIELQALISCEGSANHNTLYRSPAGIFLILCGVDYTGGDMGGSPQPSFSECIDTCAATQGCIDVSYSGNYCYMKSALNPPNEAATWAWTARKVPDDYDPENPPNPGGEVDGGGEEEGEVGSRGPTCVGAGDEGKTFKTENGKRYQIICGREYPGGDLLGVDVTSFKECIERCDATPLCVDVSYVGPGCYLKGSSAITTLQTAGWVSTALLLVRPEPPRLLSCVAGRDSETSYVTPLGNEYEILCQTDFVDGDIGMVNVDNFELCMAACDSVAGCLDVSYSGTACYMKSFIGERITADWVWNARFLRKATPSSTSSVISLATYPLVSQPRQPT